MMICSVIWPVLFPATRTWTDEKSRRLKELSGKTQFLMGKIEYAKSNPSMTRGENPAEMKQRADKMMAELKTLQDEFSGAVDSPKTVSTVLKWSGVGVMALGVVGYLATKDA